MWIVETKPTQPGNDKSDYCGWLKKNVTGGANILIQLPHWLGEEKCLELAQKMCDGLNAGHTE